MVISRWSCPHAHPAPLLLPPISPRQPSSLLPPPSLAPALSRLLPHAPVRLPALAATFQTRLIGPLLSQDPASALIVFAPPGDGLLLCGFTIPGANHVVLPRSPIIFVPFWSSYKDGGRTLHRGQHPFVFTPTMFENYQQEANPRGLGPPPPNVSNPSLYSICPL